MQLNVKESFYHSVVKTYKDSYKFRIRSRVPCSDVFLIKCLISNKKKKKEKRKNGLILFIS